MLRRPESWDSYTIEGRGGASEPWDSYHGRERAAKLGTLNYVHHSVSRVYPSEALEIRSTEARGLALVGVLMRAAWCARADYGERRGAHTRATMHAVRSRWLEYGGTYAACLYCV